MELTAKSLKGMKVKLKELAKLSTDAIQEVFDGFALAAAEIVREASLLATISATFPYSLSSNELIIFHNLIDVLEAKTHFFSMIKSCRDSFLEGNPCSRVAMPVLSHEKTSAEGISRKLAHACCHRLSMWTLG